MAVWSEFKATLEKHLQSSEIITKVIFNIIKKMFDFLSEFEEVSNKISSERYKFINSQTKLTKLEIHLCQ